MFLTRFFTGTKIPTSGRCPKYYKMIFEREEVKGRAVQLLLSFSPRYSIGEVVRIIKSITARALFHECPMLKQKLWTGEMWEDGYFVWTVGDLRTREIVEQYIEYHRNLTQGPGQLEFKLR